MAITDQIFILAILLGLSAFFSGSEVALVSLDRIKVRHLVDKKRPGSDSLKKLKDNPQRMLITILIGNNLVNIAAAAMATSLALELFDNFAVGIATGVMTLLILFFGEIIPKSIATTHNVSYALLIAKPIWWLSVILKPIIFMFELFFDQFASIFGAKKRKGIITEDEIKSMLRFSSEQGVIKEVERKMIHRIFEFDDTDVTHVMTPKNDMVTLSVKSTVADAIAVMHRKKYSRLPIYEKRHDNIIGIVYFKDLLHYVTNKKLKTPISKVMNKPYVVPSTKKIGITLRQLQNRRENMAMVVDEHGTMLGLITIEDIVEELVGEIVDETESVDPDIIKLNKNTWMAKGRLDMDECKDKLPMKVPKNREYDTLSGFLLHKLGHIPKKGDEITHGKLNFIIEEMRGNRIERVKIIKK